LVAKQHYKMSELHPPLRDLLTPAADITQWHRQYQHLVDECDDREELSIGPPIRYIPDDTHTQSSLFRCLRYGIGSSIEDYASTLADYMSDLDDLCGLLDDEYIDSVRLGEAQGGELELYAASPMHVCNIEVKRLNEKC
jgi:hypothetical protein